SLWHSRITREMDLDDNEFTQFAQMHAGVLATSRMRINPYHLGYHLLEDIERRWDNPTEEELRLGRQPGQGHAKLLEVREMESDVSLLRNYLTKDLIERLDLYLYKKEDDEWVIVEKDWEKVRDGIVANMTNFGYPYITIWDADYNGNTELLLHHHFEGQELDIPYAEKTLEHIYQIWSRPVHLETIRDEKQVRLSYNGEKHIRAVLDEDE
ncbi:MAG TPA: SpoVR family protein, partial [Ktedonobacterales bacterium]